MKYEAQSAAGVPPALEEITSAVPVVENGADLLRLHSERASVPFRPPVERMRVPALPRNSNILMVDTSETFSLAKKNAFLQNSFHSTTF